MLDGTPWQSTRLRAAPPSSARSHLGGAGPETTCSVRTSTEHELSPLPGTRRARCPVAAPTSHLAGVRSGRCCDAAGTLLGHCSGARRPGCWRRLRRRRLPRHAEGHEEGVDGQRQHGEEVEEHVEGVLRRQDAAGLPVPILVDVALVFGICRKSPPRP